MLLVSKNWWKVEGIWGYPWFGYIEHQGLPPSSCPLDTRLSAWRHLVPFLLPLGIASCQKNDLGSQLNKPLSSALVHVLITLPAHLLTFPSPLNLQTPFVRPQTGFGLASSPSLLGSSIPVSWSLLLCAVGTSNSTEAACSAHLSHSWNLPPQSYQSNHLLAA